MFEEVRESRSVWDFRERWRSEKIGPRGGKQNGKGKERGTMANQNGCRLVYRGATTFLWLKWGSEHDRGIWTELSSANHSELEMDFPSPHEKLIEGIHFSYWNSEIVIV